MTKLRGKQDREYRQIPLRISLIYALLGGIWILLSDQLLSVFVPNHWIYVVFSTVKGWVYVLLNAFLIYYLVNAGFRSLQMSQEALRESESQLQLANEELEKRVAQRTALLETANKELESFSYSVSHDLRAPLRGISGFSLALLEDYSGCLDDTGRGYLNRVHQAGIRMNQLIDDLLTLSRLNRSAMKFKPVDLSRLAESITADLRNVQPERVIESRITPGIWVIADEHLIRIALENLLGNAWKFTSKVESARVELGVFEKDNEKIVYIRDNGAGFDMTYVDKLFTPFQRLHSEEEFEGTGIGLATVQRIIHRHAGRIWAEGAVNQGATFYFTIPEERF